MADGVTRADVEAIHAKLEAIHVEQRLEFIAGIVASFVGGYAFAKLLHAFGHVRHGRHGA